MPSSKPPNSSSPAGAPTPGESPELIWLRPERTGRGPRPAHSRTSIAAAAIVIADAEGLDAVSMRRVAGALGAGTMSLYNYVPKKEHLLDLMLDAVAGEYDYSGLAPTGDCRADLRRLAHEQLAALRRHPWVPALVIARPGLGPNALRYTEHFLAVTEPSGLDGTTRMEALALLNGFVCQYAQYERTAAAGAKWQADLARYLGRAAAGGEFPHLAAAFANLGPSADTPDAVFDRSLDRVITAALTPVGPV
ncbi:TetR/AcrR family transcriptional regulator C-terminal domain-containing protein [Kitasatospora purpeofusca]|uniref:TetR/AcrR family transcriptional regulator C-terminal domain-containing protein n=1 Tax=Kitasatospora purpeofusca TaxID=67352 RepID=UPI002A5AD053|nr:TetR/AcrR family transcriptional regulator C-terminal domain-containing protein [Kitasatospora purpeofusca]MDY0811212.1 TetR/AcrR family transcriptional regulator C-terminal domain-containing protein [Kitasatospora purpeofusca]